MGEISLSRREKSDGHREIFHEKGRNHCENISGREKGFLCLRDIYTMKQSEVLAQTSITKRKDFPVNEIAGCYVLAAIGYG